MTVYIMTGGADKRREATYFNKKKTKTNKYPAYPLITHLHPQNYYEYSADYSCWMC